MYMATNTDRLLRIAWVLVLCALPAIVFIPLILMSRRVLGSNVPGSFDLVVVLVSSLLIAFNPVLKGIQNALWRIAAMVLAAVVWAAMLTVAQIYLLAATGLLNI